MPTFQSGQFGESFGRLPADVRLSLQDLREESGRGIPDLRRDGAISQSALGGLLLLVPASQEGAVVEVIEDRRHALA